MAGTSRVTLSYIDYGGKRVSLVFYFPDTVVDPDDAEIQGLIAVINACIYAVNLHVEITHEASNSDTTTSSAYSTVMDKGVMTFTDSQGDPHNYKFPSLIEGVLQADKRTLNPASTELAAFISAVESFGKSRSGDAGMTYVKGHRQAARRTNIS